MATTSNFVSAANAKIILNKNESNEAVIRGLNAMTLPLGASRKIITVEEFGKPIDTKITAGASYDDLSFAGNFVTGDTYGQTLLRQYFNANTLITNMRFYLDENHFCALDLANDPNGYYQVSQFSPGQAQKSGVFPLSVTMTVGGLSVLYDKHVTAAVNAQVKVATTSTITDTESGFVTAGFAVGDVVLIDGSSANKGKSAVVTNVAAGTLTFAGTPFTQDLAAAAKLTIHGGS